jgi:DNA-binding GntR family transcriptional regulator
MATIYEQLHEHIVTGRLDAGEALRETSLATQFGVSRTPIREALRRLEQDGLVERGDRGLQVRRRSPEEILEIYEVRVALEAAAARAAAERRSPLDLIRLEQVHANMAALENPDAETMASLNRRFHGLVWAASHNATMVDALTRLHAPLMRYRETTLAFEDRWDMVIQEHANILEAIREGDPVRARDLASDHMIGARDTRLRMFAAENATEGLT